MKKSTKGILIGFASLGVIGSIMSPNEKIESIELSIPNYQAEYDINTNIPFEISVSPDNANISTLEYIADSDTITFSRSGIDTGLEEGTYNVYVASGDIKSDTISFNVVNIAAREEAEAEEERLAKELEEQKSLEEAEISEAAESPIHKETEKPQTTESSTAKESETPQIVVSEPPTQENASSANSSGSSENGSNFNTYDNATQQKTEDTYVLNTSRMKIHRPSCQSVKKIAPQNYATSSSSLDELLAQGYSTCGNCF